MLNCQAVTDMKQKLLLFIFMLVAVVAFSQYNECGIPQIKNFSPADYRQESQNFSVVQDKNSLMYFGNANGIMEYDNEKWDIVKIPGRPKLAVSENNEVYFGGYNTFGRLQYKGGRIGIEQFVGHDDETFGQVNIIVASGSDLYFCAGNKLFMYADSSLSKLIDGEAFALLNLGDSVYVQKKSAPLKRLVHGNFEDDGLCAAISDSISVVDMVRAGNSTVMLRDSVHSCFWLYSVGEGLRRFHTDFDRYIKNNEYSCIGVLRDGNFVVGTYGGGLVSFDSEGKFRYMLNSSNGLKTNEINDLCVDNQNKVWLATENGISLLETNSELSFFNAASGLRGAVLSIIRYNGRLYVGTTIGLYGYVSHESPNGTINGFVHIRGMHDNCWSLNVYDGKLYAVANEGLFLVEDMSLRKLLDGSFISMRWKNIAGNDVVMLGGKQGLTFVGISGEKVEKLGTLNNMPYVARTVVPDSEGIWVGTNRDGLYRVFMGDSLDLSSKVVDYSEKEDLPHGFDWVDVFPTHKLGTVFSTSEGLYRYDNAKAKFYKDTTCFCSGSRCSTVYGIIGEDMRHNIWYSCSFTDAYEREVGVIRFDAKGGHKRETSAFAQMEESVVETIYPEDDNVVWFGTSDALIKYSRNNDMQVADDSAFVCMIRKVSVAGDSIIYAFDLNYSEGADLMHNIRYSDRNVRLEVAGLSYNTFGDTEYQYKLEGYDDDWSDWTTDSYKEYISLSEGSYKFMVRSRNGYGQMSNIACFNFEVAPPFYRSILAYILYFLSFVAIIVVIIAWRNIVHTNEKYHLEKIVEMRTNELVMQKEQTEKLVQKLLPQNAMFEIQTQGMATSKKYDMVTVLFSDIQGFTKIAATTNPEELIKYLNELFVTFDNIISKYNIEKIKTIGDAYMCAGGMPNIDAINRVDVVLAGMEMQRALDNLNQKHDLKMKMRLGVHTGPVVAGVVGAQKIEYDIWGDTVNIASRMESHGEVGRVNVSEETYRHVKEFFVCENRGMMDVKNKGEMEMYFVNGILEELSENGDGITPNHLFDVRRLSLNFSVMQNEVLERMQHDLPNNLYYHNIKHTTDAIYRVTDIGIKEKVSEEDLLLLRCAALFHDTGFMVSYDNNEAIGANLAQQFLARYKFTREQIDVVKGIINATKVPQNPHNLLEEIMCDADLDYLGRPDFIPISQNLFRELFERNKIDSIEQWNRMQYKFITEHQYFTETAKRNGEPGKKQVLKELKELI